jgi:hypothetical protein
MKLKTIALASAFAILSTLALAQTGPAATAPERSGKTVNGAPAAAGTTKEGMPKSNDTTGLSRNGAAGGPNGTAGGPTSLCGTGSSKTGGG